MNKLKVLFGITLIIVSFMFIGYPRVVAYDGGGGSITYVTPTAVAPTTTTQQTTTTVSQTLQKKAYCGPKTTTSISIYPTSCVSPSSCVAGTYVQTSVTINIAGGSPECYSPPWSITYYYYPDTRRTDIYYTGTVSGYGSHTIDYYATYGVGAVTSKATTGSGVYYSEATANLQFSPKPNAAPVISAFTATPSSGIEPLTVTFSGSATDAEGDPLTYTLIFDTTNTAVNVTGTINIVLSALGTHTYNIGSHTARLIVRDATNTASINTIVTVSPNNAPVITAFTANPAAGIDPITAVFRGSATDADGDPLTYTLIFDINNAAANTTGSINSVLSVLDSNVYHVGNYTARLIVKDATHAVSADAAIYVFANHAPVIGTFTATPSFGLEPLTVNFNGAATDIDGDTLTYTLIFDSTNTAVNATGSISSIVSLLSSQVYPAGTYTAELLVSDGINRVTATTGITVASNTAPVITAFTATPNSGSNPLTVNFDGSATDTDGDPLTYTLIFDTTDTATNATGTITSVLSALGSHIYSTGTYNAELIVSDGIAETTAITGITVVPNNVPAITAFTATPSSGRELLNVQFDGSATDADLDKLTYTLIFDTADASANVTGTIADVISALGTHAYAAGTYTAELIVSDGIAETTATTSVTSNVNQIPVVMFIANPSFGREPLDVTFEGAAIDADGDPLTYVLIFDNTDTTANVTGTLTNLLSTLTDHIYSVGIYTAELIVSDGIDEVVTTTPIIVNANAAPAITAFTATPDTGREPLDVIFYGSATDADGDPLTYTLIFDNTDVLVNVTGTLTDILSALGSYTYSAGTYTADLIVSDGAYVISTTTSITATANTAPVITAFTATPSSGREPLNVMFEGSATDADGDPLTYTLIFDDSDVLINVTGTITDVLSALGSYNYSAFTYYTAELIVSDGAYTTTATTTITVATNVAPAIIAFDATPDTGITPLTVVFNGSATDADGDPLTYILFFDSTNTALNATGTITDINSVLSTFVYSVGTYTAELRVSDGAYIISTTIPITVSSVPNIPPVAVFTINATSGIIPFDVSTDGSWSWDFDGYVNSYSWKVTEPDGTISIQAGTGIPYGIVYTFNKSGIYKVNLTVWDNQGGEGSTETNVFAYDPNLVVNSFTPSVSSGTAPLTTEFCINFTGDLPVNYTLFFDVSNRSLNVSGELNSTYACIANYTYDTPGDYVAEIDLTNIFTNATTTIVIHVLAPTSGGGGGNGGIILGQPNPIIAITGGITYFGFHPSYALNGTRFYSYDNVTNTTTIILRIVNMANYNRTLIIKDMIPKDFAATLSDVQIIPAPGTVYNPDPIIGWNVTLAAKQVLEIKYIFNKYIPWQSFEAMSFPSITEVRPEGQTNVSPTTRTTAPGGITGFVIGALGNPIVGAGVAVLIIIVLLSFTDTGRQTWHGVSIKTGRFISTITEELEEPEEEDGGERVIRFKRLVKQSKKR
jgi:PKD repeat protein